MRLYAQYRNSRDPGAKAPLQTQRTRGPRTKTHESVADGPPGKKTGIKGWEKKNEDKRK